MGAECHYEPHRERWLIRMPDSAGVMRWLLDEHGRRADVTDQANGVGEFNRHAAEQLAQRYAKVDEVFRGMVP